MAETIGDYIKKLRTQNVPDDQIKQSLLSVGWSIPDVITALYPPPAPDSGISNPPRPNSKGVHSMWDAFEHILLFISLYVLAVSITLILHFFIDFWLPGITEERMYSYSSASWRFSMLRGYTSAVIVAYPLFTFFFWRLTKRTLNTPSLRTLKSRKFLIYFTLVITFLIMLGYVIAAIYNFLNGNLTFNFILHIITTITVAGIVFGYYLQQVREDRTYE